MGNEFVGGCLLGKAVAGATYKGSGLVDELAAYKRRIATTASLRRIIGDVNR